LAKASLAATAALAVKLLTLFVVKLVVMLVLATIASVMLTGNKLIQELLFVFVGSLLVLLMLLAPLMLTLVVVIFTTVTFDCPSNEELVVLLSAAEWQATRRMHRASIVRADGEFATKNWNWNISWFNLDQFTQ